MDKPSTVDISENVDHATRYSAIENALDLASDQGRMSWVIERAKTSPPWAAEERWSEKRIAAIVPVADAEYMATALRGGPAEALIGQVFRIIELHQVEHARFIRERPSQQTCLCGVTWNTAVFSLAAHWREVTGKWAASRT